MEEEIKLELGYELLSLVNKEHGTLLDGITKLRELHPEIPKIRIMDNMNLEPNQFSIGKKKYIFESNPEDISIILDAISEYAKNTFGISLCKNYKTGDSLSLKLMNPSSKEFNINFMLADYPSFWNSQYNSYYDENSNCKYCFFITEISEVSDGLYKFEIINTDVDKGNRRYCFGGRFKYYLKKGDTITLQYYENTDYIVKATVFDIKNNSITFSFDKEVTIPSQFFESNASSVRGWI